MTIGRIGLIAFNTVLVGGAIAAIGAVGFYNNGWGRDLFPRNSVTKCADFTPHLLNNGLANNPLIKLSGIKVLEVLQIRDLGSKVHPVNCSVDVLLSAGGEMTLSSGTREINGKSYIFISLFD
jgi:hypothetical protein